ncbi:MAG TPA: ornithine carbamoyltransferase [bacterium]|nr:ornithine carbamoyltransferase [Candidatus Omnitrophota bacterium]HOL94422.1 ornithine carbamoyltransferase [bacterium]HPO99523.1 ornithine carbamoyltransferase [bacterium]HXK94371.1 ornithine carbamoyltransferase [bacterium]
MTKMDLRSIADLDARQMQEIFLLAADMKDHPENYTSCLKGRTMAMINEKQSLRTKVTFETGIQQLGGFAVYLTNQDINLGKREPVKDIARNLSRWVDLIVARVYRQATILEMAEYASIPVINALSDESHPCQAVSDMFTLWDQVRGRDSLRGFKLAYIGDGNNVCHSLILIAGLVGLHLVISTPPGYEPEARFVDRGRRMAEEIGGLVTFEPCPRKAVAGADGIYTDVWTSMGQEAETAKRLVDFKDYQVNDELLSHAPDHVKIMHCLPAHRGEEITDSVLESPRSIVFDQAENRLHGQKAIMKYLLDHSRR